MILDYFSDMVVPLLDGNDYYHGGYRCLYCNNLLELIESYTWMYHEEEDIEKCLVLNTILNGPRL